MLCTPWEISPICVLDIFWLISSCVYVFYVSLSVMVLFSLKALDKTRWDPVLHVLRSAYFSLVHTSFELYFQLHYIKLDCYSSHFIKSLLTDAGFWSYSAAHCAWQCHISSFYRRVQQWCNIFVKCSNNAHIKASIWKSFCRGKQDASNTLQRWT